MKKLLFVLLLISSFSALTQNAFYDALFLATLDEQIILNLRAQDNITSSEKSELDNLIEFMKCPLGSTKVNMTLIKSAFQKQILKVNQNYTLYSRGNETIVSNKSVGSPGIAMGLLFGKTSLSDSIQSRIIDGIAKYYAEEFRKAQTVTYLKGFERTIGQVGELEIIFPETYNKLKRMDPSKFPDLGNEFKKIFYQDLKSVWPSILSYIKNYPEDSIADGRLSFLQAKHVTRFKQSKYFYPLLVTSDIMDMLLKNQHPVDILNYVASQKPSDHILSLEGACDIYNTIKSINLLQNNLRDTAKIAFEKGKAVWISLETLGQLDTEMEMNYFFGLLKQQDSELFRKWFTENVEIDTLMQFYKDQVFPLVRNLKDIETLLKEVKQSDADELYTTYSRVLLELLSDNEILVSDKLRSYFKVAGSLQPIYQGIREGEFSNTLYYLNSIMQLVLAEEYSDFNDTFHKLEQYGTFMAEIIEVDDSDAMESVIRKYAAPPASFLLKRTYDFTVSITGQPGYFASIEKLDETNKPKFVSGITLPMGLELTKKLSKTKVYNKTKASLGLFIQVIDMGAVLNFRLDDDVSDLPEKITFEQILSPGASLVYGFPNSAFTLALGYQRTPELRKVTTGNSVNFEKGDRFFIRGAWDIPFINLAKTRK